MKEPLELPSSLLEHNLWLEKSNPVWPATVFQCKRNIARSNFPGKLSSDELLRLYQLLEKEVTKFFGNENCKVLPADRLSPLDKEFLCEHFLCREGFQNAGIGQGFVVDLKGKFLALLNVQDHLSLHWIDTADSWDKTWDELARFEEAVSKELAFAFSPQFGYLTANPHECDTALVVMAYLHVPTLFHTKALDAILGSLEEVEITGLEGTRTDLLANYIIVKNAFTLGVSEQEVLRAVHLAATKIASAEKALREQISREGNTEIKDLVSRAYGLLIHSYQLNTREALSALSLVKLGIDLGWVEGIADQAANQLFLQSGRAHLLKVLGQNNEESQQIHHDRASFLHQKLKGLRLKEDLA